MKKYLPILTFALLSVVFLTNPSAAKAATAGPVDVQQLRAVQGPNAGQVTLWWMQHGGNVSAYHIVYGTKSVTYQYSALNIPSAGVGVEQSFTVSALTPGKTYYFALVPVANGYPHKPSLEVAMVAKPGVIETSTTTATVPTTTTASTAGPVGSNMLTATSGPKSGQVKLTWVQQNVTTTNYNLSYGTASQKYTFGALNIGTAGIGKLSSFTVSALVPGRRYYFEISPIQNGYAAGWSKEVTVVAR